jgi:hypothetical protein
MAVFELNNLDRLYGRFTCLDHLAWVAHYSRKIRHITNDDSPSSNIAPLAYFNAGNYHRTSPDVCALSYRYVPAKGGMGPPIE